MKIAYRCNTVGVFNLAYNIIDNAGKEVQYPAIVRVSCVENTCFGIKSTNNTVCTGRGKCTGTDLCTCSTGYAGTKCEECASYDACGICNGPSTVCTKTLMADNFSLLHYQTKVLDLLANDTIYNNCRCGVCNGDGSTCPDPLPTQGLEIQQYVDCSSRTLPDSELTPQEKTKGVAILEITAKAAYLPGLTGIIENVTCIAGAKSQYLNGLITYTTTEDSQYSQVTKMAIYKLRVTVNDLVECFGAQIVSAQKIGTTAVIDIYNRRLSDEYNASLDTWAKARNITFSDPSIVYKDSCTFGITSLSYGTSSVAFNPGNLGYTVNHLTTRFDETIEKIETLIQICVNYPSSGKPHEWLAFNSSGLINSDDVHTTLTLGYFEPNCSSVYTTKCCQTFALLSDLAQDNCLQRRDANTFTINVVGPNSIDQTKIAVVTDISICYNAGPTDVFVDKVPTSSLILYQEKQLQIPASVYVQGTRVWSTEIEWINYKSM